jgi:hypothetical protein
MMLISACGIRRIPRTREEGYFQYREKTYLLGITACGVSLGFAIPAGVSRIHYNQHTDKN